MISLFRSSSVPNGLKVFLARRKLRKLNNSNKQKLARAEQEGDFDWADTIKTDWGMEISDVWNVCHRYDTAKLLAQAERLGFSLEDVPKAPGEYTHWDQDERIPSGTLHWHSFRTLKTMVAKARKDRSLERRETLKAVSPIISGIGGALVGSVATLIGQALFLHSK
jgi:hypothetical protein